MRSSGASHAVGLGTALAIPASTVARSPFSRSRSSPPLTWNWVLTAS